VGGARLQARREARGQGRARHRRRLGHRPGGRCAVRSRGSGCRDQFPVDGSRGRQGHGRGRACLRTPLRAAARGPRARGHVRAHRRADGQVARRARHPRLERRAPEPQGQPRGRHRRRVRPHVQGQRLRVLQARSRGAAAHEAGRRDHRDELGHGIAGIARAPDYSSTKGAINAFTRTMGRKLAERGFASTPWRRVRCGRRSTPPTGDARRRKSRASAATSR
jgi:hypothetical protein